MIDPRRRDFLSLLAASAVTPLGQVTHAAGINRLCRIRTITAGIGVSNLRSLAPFEATLKILERSRAALVAEGYEVQTIRIATTPFVAGLSLAERVSTAAGLRALDALMDSHGAVVSIGPVLLDGSGDEGLTNWVAELLASTKRLSASIVVASPERGVNPAACTVAAQTMVALSKATPGGLGNFRFAASCNIPAGTPFFPVAYHQGADSLALGLESPGLVQAAFKQSVDAADATRQLQSSLDAACQLLEPLMMGLAQRSGRSYLGIDPSPAPGMDRSIGAALETLIGGPFGSAATLSACAATTSALKALSVRTCGYAGLMLPVPEDPVLAKRSTEGRFGWKDLLLFSSVCGTGLDLLPLPGDTPVDSLARIIGDTAALSAKWRKALSARLLLVPGKKAGQVASFDDPMLTDCAVFSVD